MNAAVEIFKPGIAELRSLAERLRGITIKGVDDVEGYTAAKEAKKELAQWRIDITKAGKKFREEALAYQREVIRQEKEHLEIITPVEDSIKAMIEAVDEAKAREERKELLPARQALLAEIEVTMTEEEILSLDEKQFSEMYMSKKMAYLEAREAKRKEAEEAERREKETKEREEAAAAKAVEEERLRVEREKKDAEEKAAREEADRKAEEARLEKNRRYKAWLKGHGVEGEDPNFKIERVGTTFVLYKKVDEITIA